MTNQELKPNTWYFYEAPDNENYVHGQTRLYEGVPPIKSRVFRQLHTDKNGDIIHFVQVGEVFTF